MYERERVTMKKIYGLILAACALVSFCHAGDTLEKLEEAIAQSRLSRVKTLLNKTARDKNMSQQARTKMLGNLYDTAAEVTDKRIENLWLLGNWRDIAKTFTGTLFTLGGVAALGLGVVYGGSTNQQVETACFWGKIGGSILAPLGAFLFYKGFTCSSQRSMIAEATEVEEYIDGILNNAEILEGDDTQEKAS